METLSNKNHANATQFTDASKKCFVKVVAIGDSGVGKTSLIQMFEHSKYTESFKPTIGADFSNKEMSINGKCVTLQIWDTAGQERYQSLGTAFYRGADCCFLVYDVTNPQSFQNLVTWKNSFLQKSMVVNPDTFPFIVVGNKIDLEENRQVSTHNGQRYCSEHGDMLFAETSAKENKNVEDGFRKVAERALARQQELQKVMEENTKVKRESDMQRNKKLGRTSKVQQQPKNCMSC